MLKQNSREKDGEVFPEKKEKEKDSMES